MQASNLSRKVYVHWWVKSIIPVEIEWLGGSTQLSVQISDRRSELISLSRLMDREWGVLDVKAQKAPNW